MKKLKSITMVLALMLTVGVAAQNADDQRIMDDAEEAKQEMLTKDSGLENYFDTAEGYVIFPNVGEGGFIIGAASGNGVVYENGTAVGMANLKKVDVGFQIGGQALAEVIFFETEDALNEFKTDEFTFSGEVSATAVKQGVSENLNYNDGVIVLAMPKAGLMADVSVGGQKFTYTPMNELDQ
ncbi:lipid-binding SYLF domain-containing protein [Costertonia aggregata]|uniref:Lipid-binding SYLF domain-containing protein n=1 Tax=Costertonia aggregata TaxID=343403 RepID=A0A7H9AT87_9FLAO|nr:lipid-binding SYLF domain-containing protein [Costertonia aggregata]QLG46562.1 lipid-binding SYLF domain-containing protein [Costertonia aggregata]